MYDPAPYRADLAKGPEVSAVWLRSSDELRLRASHVAGMSAKGTVFLLPGRTEYIEKYGYVTDDLVSGGFDVVSIDWRGQGMADRLIDDRNIGHVARFSDFQKDWAALVAFAKARNAPRPWHMIAHSMGGCIGLRALMQGADITSAVFTGPMWGITMASYLRPLAWLIPKLAELLGQGHQLTFGTSRNSYLLAEPFKDNLLTTDPDMWAYMKSHVEAEPRFGLGGPSMTWLRTALDECNALAQLPSPAIPALCFLGSNERIVDTDAIRTRMTQWPGGKLLLVDGAEHEVLMEGENIRRQVTGSAISLFSRFAT